MNSNLQPNFFIVGAAKSGTTSLYHQLITHPEISMPMAVKETFFFTELFSGSRRAPGWDYLGNPPRSFDEYSALFSKGQNVVTRGEACVAYLYFYEQTIAKMKLILCNVPKIIVILRNPIERAISNYLHHVRDGKEPLPFERAIQAESTRHEEGWWWGFQYTKVGLYYGQVNAYINAFGSKNIKVIVYEEYLTDPRSVIEQILQFLEVDSSIVPDLSLRINVSGIPRNRLIYKFVGKYGLLGSKLARLIPPRIYNSIEQKLLFRPTLAASTRDQLVNFYRDDIDKLEDLLQRDLQMWVN